MIWLFAQQFSVKKLSLKSEINKEKASIKQQLTSVKTIQYKPTLGKV